jgi:hypothetical protein
MLLSTQIIESLSSAQVRSNPTHSWTQKKQFLLGQPSLFSLPDKTIIEPPFPDSDHWRVQTPWTMTNPHWSHFPNLLAKAMPTHPYPPGQWPPQTQKSAQIKSSWPRSFVFVQTGGGKREQLGEEGATKWEGKREEWGGREEVGGDLRGMEMG